MYINDEDAGKLPSTNIINMDNISYKIFITEEIITCFTCKQAGHNSNQCKSTSGEIISNITTESNKRTASPSSQILKKKTEMMQDKIPTSQDNQIINSQKKKRIKRQTNITEDVNNNTKEQDAKREQEIIKEKERPRFPSASPAEELWEEQIKGLDQLIQSNPGSYILNQQQFKNFLEDINGKQDQM